MRSDDEIENEIRRLEWELYNSPDWEIKDGIEARIHRLKIELRDPAALLPDTDLREVDGLVGTTDGGRL